MSARQPLVSAALLAANRRLLAMREACGVESRLLPVSKPASPSRFDLPPHLGWGTASLTKALRQAEERKSRRIEAKTAVSLPSSTLINCTPAPPTPSSPPKAFIRIHPSIDAAARATGQATACRVWHLLRQLDEAGSGWLALDVVRERLTRRESRFCIYGWRRLRQLLQAGEGLFWQRDGHGRLFLSGAAKVAARLDVTYLEGHPVLLPQAAVLKNLTSYQAHVYAAWHSGRKTNNPVSRATIAQQTAVCPRTQIIYEQMLGLKVTSNFAVGQPYSLTTHKEAAWQHGGSFEFKDTKGKLGVAKQCYVAWRLPNSYAKMLEAQPRSATRKRINQAKDLRQIRARGTGQGKRLYHADGRAAAEAVAKQKAEGAVYWEQKNDGLANGRFWHALRSE